MSRFSNTLFTRLQISSSYIRSSATRTLTSRMYFRLIGVYCTMPGACFQQNCSPAEHTFQEQPSCKRQWSARRSKNSKKRPTKKVIVRRHDMTSKRIEYSQAMRNSVQPISIYMFSERIIRLRGPINTKKRWRRYPSVLRRNSWSSCISREQPSTLRSSILKLGNSWHQMMRPT